MEQVCCFFGHRKIDETDELKTKLYETIENLITSENTKTFLFGSRSEFDNLCYSIVTDLKEKYPYIKRVFVRGEYPYIDDRYKKYLLKSYEDTYFPESAINAGKAVYIKRNFNMIENSKFCVVYYKEDYQPPRKKQSRNSLGEYQPKSGTKTAYEYAKKKEKRIINVI